MYHHFHVFLVSLWMWTLCTFVLTLILCLGRINIVWIFIKLGNICFLIWTWDFVLKEWCEILPLSKLTKMKFKRISFSFFMYIVRQLSNNYINLWIGWNIQQPNQCRGLHKIIMMSDSNSRKRRFDCFFHLTYWNTLITAL